MRGALMVIASAFGGAGVEARTSVPLVVERVEFGRAILSGGDAEWFEVAIEVRSGSRDPVQLRQSVRLGLDLAWRSRAGGKDDYITCRSEVLFLLPQAGEERTVCFYLHPDFVRRTDLRGAPAAWRIRLEQDGRSLGQPPATFSDSLQDPVSAQTFVELFREGGGEWEGVLQPIYHTPFFGGRNRRSAESPAFLRAETWVERREALSTR